MKAESNKHLVGVVRKQIHHHPNCNSEHPHDPGPCDCVYDYAMDAISEIERRLDGRRNK